MSKIIAITGVTGNQVFTDSSIQITLKFADKSKGSSIVETFLHLPGWKIRGITRNPSGEVAQALIAKGVEIFKGDLDDKQSLLPVFEGAAVIFSNTDFFSHFFEAVASNETTKGRTPNEYAFDREVEQGINIAEAASAPTVLKTLEHFIFSTLSDAKKWSKGKYTYIYHNDTKIEILRATQSRFPEVAARMSTLLLGHFVETWKIFPPLLPQKQPDGSFLVNRTFPPDYKMPFVVARKDTGPFVKALVDLPPGKNLLGVSENMTWPDYAKLWGDALGVKSTFKQVSYDEYFEGVPDLLKKELTESFEYMMEYGVDGGDPEVLSMEQVSCFSLQG